MMKENKKGKSFTFSKSFILLLLVTLDYVFSALQTDNRWNNKATEKNLPDYPSYGHICKRIDLMYN